ncbi:hypothetical protein Tco_0924853 [Tanacetum coccineum]|uniref:Myb/SANT-like domain-containing protein n=1 Tax=Tanacetum coccineum TaxID=301880 RepID=A0ABQ5DC60_9ASTR
MNPNPNWISVDETEEEEEPLPTPTSKPNRGRKKSVAKKNKGKDVEVEKETKEGRIRHAWTQAKELLLAESFIQISEDPKTGCDQKLSTFWYKILDVYNQEANKKGFKERTKNMLTGKWTPMNAAVMKFNQLYEETLAHSEETDENHMARVLQLYETIVGVASNAINARRLPFALPVYTLVRPSVINDYLSRKQFAEDKENYLEHPIPAAPVAAPGQQVPPRALAAHTAWVKGAKEIDALMLMTMELDIQRNLTHLGAYDMLQELKTMFAQQAE